MSAAAIDPVTSMGDDDLKKAATAERDVEDKGSQETGDVAGYYVVDRALEKRLLWKFDIYILPMLSIMYLFK